MERYKAVHFRTGGDYEPITTAFSSGVVRLGIVSEHEDNSSPSPIASSRLSSSWRVHTPTR